MLSVVKSLLNSVPYNTSMRADCCFCGGLNTLSITNTGTSVKYHCFRLNCGKSGVIGDTPSHDEIGRILKEKGVTEAKQTFKLPTYCTPGLGSINAFNLIKTTNGWIAYNRDDYRTAYDSINNRLLYLLQENNKVVGAVGRALSAYDKPKSMLYPDSKIMPFIVGNSDVGVIVEDCASAASVNSMPEYTGIALLGTEFKHEYVPYIHKRFKRLFIALDPDAKKKAVALKDRLSYITKDVKVWALPRDFKNMNKEEVKAFIERNDR